jgi:release factor glutamine methyltransferase
VPACSLRRALTTVSERLTAAGVPSPRTDADLLVAHVLGVPRPETETLLTWADERLRGRDGPVVVDLCTGSAALALAVAALHPDAEVHAVEVDPDALVWARRNAEGTGVHVHEGDVADPGVLDGLVGRVDLVVANPPYVPDATEVPPEVHHDPARAVFGGADGLAVVRPLATLAARLLRPGGGIGVEHDASHAAAVRDVLLGAGFIEVIGLDDLAGRPRVATGASPCE